MPENIVVVAGAAVASSVGLPALHGLSDNIANHEHYSKMLSPQEYGNYLPEFWQFAKERALEAIEVQPSDIHKKLAEKQWTIITQNIGSIHKRAGSENVLEVYGSLFVMRCLRCQHEENIDAEFYRNLEDGEVPACVNCGKNRTRPDICLPGENMRHRKVTEKILSDSNIIIYLGVDSGSGPIATWYNKVPYSILVNEHSWGNFDKVFEMSPNEWANEGLPIHSIK